jgi:threonine dehydrogenase-like Zn-dependent dehydrogenase
MREGDVVVVFGAGPVGLFAAKSAWLMGAGRVIVIDHIDYRLEFARLRQRRDDQLQPGERHRAVGQGTDRLPGRRWTTDRRSAEQLLA